MRGFEFAELTAFVAIAEERSFRRAAARLGLMPSTLSHALRDLEERLGVRLINRTTRSVSPTEAGERLLLTLAPALRDVRHAVETVNDFRETPAGTVRLSVPRMAAMMILAPAFERFARNYPDVVLEVALEEGFVDIVERGFDAGIRLRESVAANMIAVPVSPDQRIAVVASPAYLADHPPPQTPFDLAHHRCIGYRQVASGALYRWEFEKQREEIAVPVPGAFILDDPELMVAAALAGAGLTYTTQAYVAQHLQDGRLVRVLEDWCPFFPGFVLYYPSRRQVPGALRALIEVLRI
ncbi:LysR family transcriptional regulator [Luteimonas panaciterrae]|uniref:LysR family transcriptional regulator n=1 Tax=Luteimonas panaciterrae TaxID=363885 RepID=UPI001CFA070E|nr:LysR family transcriptional regulator [Luteimonas panaciterrae]